MQDTYTYTRLPGTRRSAPFRFACRCGRRGEGRRRSWGITSRALPRTLWNALKTSTIGMIAPITSITEHDICLKINSVESLVLHPSFSFLLRREPCYILHSFYNRCIAMGRFWWSWAFQRSHRDKSGESDAGNWCTSSVLRRLRHRQVYTCNIYWTDCSSITALMVWEGVLIMKQYHCYHWLSREIGVWKDGFATMDWPERLVSLSFLPLPHH